MQEYIDGFLLPVPKANVPAYQKMADQAKAVWLEHGALDYREGVADDLASETFRSFREAANAKDDETVVFAWIVYASKAERDRINALVMADPRLANTCCEGVFDFKRMCWGGFSTLVAK
ncbi:MAG: DUF1428 domain-containing protein [Achromobacter sp.]|uniref:DUF1428 domain-containing protein n=1 Tax=unclassified Achromobacter TaxID=2626865 RepID=UPI000E75A0C8|nr:MULTISPECIES: DUF1428 domain-containing protein [unclassified Achromobacter]AYD65514.1 DUF1428 domain-containing protein [Achromobacter sp. B7]MDX3985306.1 DUF1428 domain-containing protein [Achromobacter sp.]